MGKKLSQMGSDFIFLFFYLMFISLVLKAVECILINSYQILFLLRKYEITLVVWLVMLAFSSCFQSSLFMVVLVKTKEVPERRLGFWAEVSLHIHYTHGDSSSNQDYVSALLRLDCF